MALISCATKYIHVAYLCYYIIVCISSVQCSVVSDSLRPHGLQHARRPCPSPTPGAYPISRPLSRWCHPTISSSVVPFSSCLQSFPASGQHWLLSNYQKKGLKAELYNSHVSLEAVSILLYAFFRFFQVPYRNNSYLSFSFCLTSLKHNIL